MTADTKTPLWPSAADLNKANGDLAKHGHDTDRRFCEGRDWAKRTRCRISWKPSKRDTSPLCPPCREETDHG